MLVLYIGGPADGQRIEMKKFPTKMALQAQKSSQLLLPHNDFRPKPTEKEEYFLAQVKTHKGIVPIYHHQSIAPEELMATIFAGYFAMSATLLPVEGSA